MKIKNILSYRSLIGVIIVLISVSLVSGGLYYYSSELNLETSEISEELTVVIEEAVDGIEEVISSEQGLSTEQVLSGEKPIMQKCDDGTLHGQCSLDRPKYCEDGKLIDLCSKCECLPGMVCQDNECIGKVWDLVASNDPDDYLGDYIHEEVYSDWKNYQPIVDRVEELVDGLDNDYDKAEAIADWVKQSKSYGFPSEAHLLEATLIDIFNSNRGVCFDASILTTALLRLVDIPARSVLTSSGARHAFVEAYIDGEWIGIEPVFYNLPDEYESLFDPRDEYLIEPSDRGGANFIPNLSSILSTSVRAPADNLLVRSKKLSIDAQEMHIVEIGGEDYNVENVTHFQSRRIPRDNYGYIYYPITSEPIACKAGPRGGCLDYSLEFDEAHRAHAFLGNLFISKDIECNFYHCNQVDSPQKLLILSPVSFYKGYFLERQQPEFSLSEVAACNEPCWGRAYLKKAGYYKITLPSGKYTIKYKANTDDLAYYDFEVKAGETVIISPDDLKKFPDADLNGFNISKELLRKSVKGIIIE